MCEIFDMLVRPVGAYGAHVWGPSMFQRFLHDPLNVDNAVERCIAPFSGSWLGWGSLYIKSHCTRSLAGNGLMVQWLVLAARWWNTVLGESQGCLALTKALGDDVSLISMKHKQCWSRELLDAMSTIKVIDKSKWHPRKGELSKEDTLKQVRFDEERVRVCAERWFDRAWEACNSDPTVASEEEVFRSTYKH